MYFEDDPDGVPDFVGARDHVIGELIGFVDALRSAGVAVPANAAIDAARALAEVGLADRDRVRIALRATLVSRPGDLADFDRLFPQFWRRLMDGPASAAADGLYLPGSETPVEAAPTREVPAADAAPPSDGADTDGPEREAITTRLSIAESGAIDPDTPPDDGATASVYSPTGRPERVSGVPDRLDAADDPLARGLARLTASIAGLRGRRWARPGGERIDTRRALRRSFGTGGTVLAVPHEARQRSAVRAVLLVDVSQSVLDTIDRGFLIRFLRAVVEAWRSVRVFFFDTSVREVTDQFDAETPHGALAALERAEAEWGGGTRIGHAVETIRDDHPDAIDRGTVVFVLSDGLEVGEIDVLEAGLAWLARRAAAILWLNPLAGSSAYEPTCRGMEAALPYVDGLFAFADPTDVEEIARQIEQQGLHGRIGYQYDPRRRSPPSPTT